MAQTRRSTRSVFGPAAPTQNLKLPEGVVILLAEIIVYFSNHIRNYDVLLRLIQAATTQAVVANLTITGHRDGDCAYDYDSAPDDLTCNGMQLNCELDQEYFRNGQIKNPPIESIPLAGLAIDVNTHPSYARGDGFMFVRCVQYATLHPEKQYMFPNDLAYLMAKLDDGRQLLAHHFDNATAERWLNKDMRLIDEHPNVEIIDDVEDSDGEEMDGPVDASPVFDDGGSFSGPPGDSDNMPITIVAPPANPVLSQEVRALVSAYASCHGNGLPRFKQPSNCLAHNPFIFKDPNVGYGGYELRDPVGRQVKADPEDFSFFSQQSTGAELSPVSS
ncbi:hypothetical protein EK21DRAFT_108201 [Setomelanomma holmii]|uniref:Uncharacterized protein n=1 Tax=Setomelanomma holmii TaxID=210430 RepID=A0A9P4LRW5_9PLEO|nr:hypothetical protein EK21DRAFT_108201 [Setomelanomma holmii]